MDQPPTADQVARIIVEACKAVGCNPLQIADGRHPYHKLVNRARAYAAFAIRDLFPENGSVRIGRMVGASAPKCFVSSLRYQLERGELRWWSDDTFVRIVRGSAAKLGLDAICILKPSAAFQLRARIQGSPS